MYFKKNKNDIIDALEYLNANHPYLYTYVIHIGTPTYSNSVKTMAVIWEGMGSYAGIKFLVNEKFLKQLSVQDSAFVIAHEALHIALKHHLTYNLNKEYFSDFSKFNIATDLIINDALIYLGFNKPEIAGHELYYGEDVVGYDASHESVFDVYPDIPDNYSKKNSEDSESDEDSTPAGPIGGTSFTEIEGLSEDYADTFGEYTNAGNPPAYTEDSNAKDIIDDIKKKDNEASKGIGSSFSLESVEVSKLREQGKQWTKLLKEIDPDIMKMKGPKISNSFHRQPKKLSGLYDPYGRNGILPVRTVKPNRVDGDKPTVVMFMDTSGSCRAYTKKFITLANTVPRDKINLLCWTFSTRTVRLDLNKEKQSYASGGTSFSPIESTIQKDVVKIIGSYPKSVIVVTDGMGHFYQDTEPSGENKSKWNWLILDASYAHKKGPFGENYKFSQFFK